MPQVENTMNLEVLFKLLQIRGLTLKNRVVMAPMSRSFFPNGVPGQNVAAYYRRRAEGGVGLLLSEGTVVDRAAARNDPNIPDFHGEAALDGWKCVIDEVHAAGGRMGPQIWHMGSMPTLVKDYVPTHPAESPSGLIAPGKNDGNTMTEEDIAETIAAHGRAAAEAKRLGFDVVEIHACHGFLLDQFFWAGTNQREDRYGGPTLEERSRVVVEVIRSVREAVGPDFPVLIRLSQWKLQDYNVRLATTPGEMAEWLIPLAEAGVDVIDCSQRRFWEPEFPEVDGTAGLNFAGWAKKLTGAATISVGSVGLSGEVLAAYAGESSKPTSLDELVRRMEHEEFDLIAVGRALLNDPLWLQKVQTGNNAEQNDFNPTSFAKLI